MISTGIPVSSNTRSAWGLSSSTNSSGIMNSLTSCDTCTPYAALSRSVRRSARMHISCASRIFSKLPCCPNRRFVRHSVSMRRKMHSHGECGLLPWTQERRMLSIRRHSRLADILSISRLAGGVRK